MVVELSNARARQLRLRAQGLVDRRERTATADVVHDSCGLQAQEASKAPLGIRVRSQGVTASDVEAAREEERTIVRTWSMRGTLHYVTVADLSWLQSLFGPLYIDRGARRLADLGLDEDDRDRAVEIIRDALTHHGPLTRSEIADRLLDEGFQFDPDGQAPVHVVRRACLEGVACEAASPDGTETYALLDDWVSLDPAPDRENALAELARRYVTAFEPATPDDLYKWSGLYKRDVRTGWDAIEDELTEVRVAGETAWTISPPNAVESDGTPVVRLLPMYDNYFLGHRERDLVIPDEYTKHVFPGGGIIRAAVVVDGLAAGTWKLDRTRATPTVLVELFESFDRAVESEIEKEVENLGRFLDRGVEYTISESG